MRCNKLLPVLMLSTLFVLPITGAIAADSAAAAPTFGDYQAKGFLSDYSKIPTTPAEDGSYRYLDPNVDGKKYNKLLVDRIKIWFKDDAEYKGIDPDELKMLTDYFYSAIEKAMGDAYPMVKEAGPDVLRLRIAITDVEPNQVVASVTTLVVPFLWVGDAGTGVAKGEPGSTVFTGEATIEMEALDSTSSEQAAAYIQTDAGKKYNWTEGVTAGVGSYLKSYTKWDYTKEAMDHWAQMIRARLDQVHGKKTE